MQPQRIYLNGDLVPYADAKIPIHSCAVKYGAAVFEGARAYWNAAQEQLYVFRLRDHVERLFTSLRLMRMAPRFSRDDVVAAVVETMRANGAREDVYARVTAYVEGDGDLDASGPVGLAVDVRARRLTAKDALAARVSSWVRIDDRSMPPRIKATANYQNARLATVEARADGYDTPLLLNTAGKLAEAPAACCFVVRGGVPLTPPVSAGILESITRATLLDIFPEVAGVGVVEREIDRTELYVADEVFICGTAWEITPVTSVDRMPVGRGAPGPLTLAAADAYARIVRGGATAREAWLTPVWS